MSKCLFSFKDVDIYPHHVEYFGPSQWLDDVCINYCYKLFEEKCLNDRILLLDPSVVSFLRLQLDDEDEFQDFKEGLSFNSKEWLFFPISDSDSFSSMGSHWSLLIWHQTTDNFFYADSSKTYNLASAKEIAKKLLIFSGKRYNSKLMHILNVPQQQNGFDCGIYTIMFTEKIFNAIFNHSVTIDDSSSIISIKALLEEAVCDCNDIEATAVRANVKNDILSRASSRQML